MFLSMSDRIGNLIYDEREGKATEFNSNSIYGNIDLGQTCLQHFENHTVNKDTIDSIINECTVNDLTVPENCLLFIIDSSSSQCSVELS